MLKAARHLRHMISVALHRRQHLAVTLEANLLYLVFLNPLILGKRCLIAPSNGALVHQQRRTRPHDLLLVTPWPMVGALLVQVWFLVPRAPNLDMVALRKCVLVPQDLV